jgi:hypothetical protein
MTVAARLGELQQRYDQIERATDFAQIARVLLAAKGQIVVARDIAQSTPRVSDCVRRLFSDPAAGNVFVRRSSVPPATLAETTPLTEYKIAAAGFAASLANVGVFDRMLGGGFRVLPLSLLTVGAVNVGATAAVVDEAAPKPVSTLSVTASTVSIRKAAGLLVLTAELARAIASAADALVGQELRKACVRAIDGKFLAIATAGAATFASSGSNVAAFWADLGVALNALAIDDTSRLYIAMTSANAKQLALMLAQGSSTSTVMTPNGGTIAGIEVIVSDALAAGQWALIDASAFAAAADLLMLSTPSHATIQFDSSPDSPPTAPTNFVSLWQLNKLALLAERFFIAERLRTNSVALVTSASYASGFSP